MNDRFRELWQQAVLNNTKTPMNFQDAADEFAELIVEECAKICVKEARQIGGRVCADKIKQHFGVNDE